MISSALDTARLESSTSAPSDIRSVSRRISSSIPPGGIVKDSSGSPRWSSNAAAMDGPDAMRLSSPSASSRLLLPDAFAPTITVSGLSARSKSRKDLYPFMNTLLIIAPLPVPRGRTYPNLAGGSPPS